MNGPVDADAAARAGARLDAIVLAGGRSSRLGVDKAAVRVDERRLVDRVIAAARAAGADRVVVVGPAETGTRADAVVREDPPFGGPAAAIAAALPLVGGRAGAGSGPEAAPEQVLVLACDLESPDAVCTALSESAPVDAAGTVLVDASGERQWLAGRYRVDALRAAIRGLGDPAGQSLRRVLAGLPLAELRVPDEVARDIDTPQDLARALRRAEE